MKIKLDYVTNSSSTSYTFYGYLFYWNNPIFKNISEDSRWDEDLLKEEINLPRCVDVFVDQDREAIILGKCFMISHDDGGVEYEDVDLDKLTNDAKKVAKSIKETLGLTTEPKLIGGVQGA